MSKLTNKSDRAITQNKCVPPSILTYSPYGHSTSLTPLVLIRYNAEYWNRELQIYHLGLGHRPYKPSLMRFISPDRLSPFEKGGINTYSYCSGDPINYSDPSGRNRLFNKKIQPQVSHVAASPSIVSAINRTKQKDQTPINDPQRRVLEKRVSRLNSAEILELEIADPSLSRDLSASSSIKAKALITHDAAILKATSDMSLDELSGYNIADIEALQNYKSNDLTRNQALVLFDLKIYKIRLGYRFDIWDSRRYTMRMTPENQTTQD